MKDAGLELYLARRAADGDRAAFEEIYNRYFPLVWHVARGRLDDESAAEEVMQETFTIAHRSLNGFRGPNLRSWLCKICATLCCKRLHLAGRRAQLAPMLSLDECLHSYAANQDGADAIIDRSVIGAAFAQLPDDQRDALVKVAFWGYEANEVAHQRGVPASTVRSQVATARSKLHAALNDDFDLPGKKETARERAEIPAVSAPLPEPSVMEGLDQGTRVDQGS
jgi:RNA polymerase sigma-70 factor (ECF subfamily)